MVVSFCKRMYTVYNEKRRFKTKVFECIIGEGTKYYETKYNI